MAHDLPQFVFFGTSRFAVSVLEKLKQTGYLPSLIVTTPDKPSGRGLILSPPPVKIWAVENKIDVLQPRKLEAELSGILRSGNYPLFIVAAFGSILPKSMLKIPKHGVLNVHPSLLPKYRGPSPVQSAILADDKNTGVSIMLLDDKLDHGPVIASRPVPIPPSEWPPRASVLEEKLARAGGILLAEVLPRWIEGTLRAREQEHDKASYTKKIEKADGLIDLTADAYQNYLKIRAYDGWPGTYFFVEKNGKKIRVIIKDAEYKDGKLIITRVLPEGKKETDYKNFLQSLGG
jgi:methionyl-tRNA formyltransferase